MTQGKTGRWHVCRLHPSTMATLAELKPTKGSRILPWDKSQCFRSKEMFYRITDPVGLKGSLKKLRKSSASDVELHFPGMGGVHLGHHTSVSIAHNHYLDPRIVAKNRPMPTELTADLGAIAS